MTGGPTLGVEEEFLLLDPDTGENAPVVEKVLAALPDAVRAQSRLEFRHSMIEMVTPVCTELPELAGRLTDLRRAAATAATAAGAHLVAIGAIPVAEPVREPTDDRRFHAIARHYGPIAYDAAVCGCHVHVGVPDRETAVRVCTRLRPWLPVLQALTVNSPLYAGADTGHASWRSLQLARWPALGPVPAFASAADYDRTVALLVSSGAMLDDSMVLWYARPSVAYPTVEIRVADVCPAPADTVLLAALVRSLVATCLVDGGGLPVPDHLVTAAHWNAAHSGMDGTLLDLHAGTARPAWDVVADLVTAVQPALRRLGDARLVAAELDRVRDEGTGATRQRRALARGGIPAALAEVTVMP
ncbi:carboxylate-amine ligase [Couchioplanes caeruleus]|uniref:Putative glutamate--cysteine ligase 2 n=2 Tax=Couchioplanes caeruleus TaxID=56438 RepID=A0A1K0FFL0_9ACTN|nr:glutamate--cysteine ligase [Couchioplanes caeruleus]OJF11625.1 carboxylate--amine ligase [Couchioplanes caeruleus subsp. caeruleus]ROP34432.1 carboxylate-amine ligase [Couchioplanes caeruleus]